MDLVASCKDKLSHFRIKELKDVLAQLGISKQGKKQDLVERILSALSDGQVLSMARNGLGRDEVAKLVDDTYRRMQVSGATELASKSQGVSETSNAKLKEDVANSYQTEKIRCPCGSTLPNDSMIKCEDSRCGVWQHITCVVIPEKPTEGAPQIPTGTFYCERCRLTRADPFWATMAHPLSSVKLVITSVPADGSTPLQSVEKTFQVTRADKELLLKPEFDIQAWCMLLNDKVPFRMQWPQYADLQVNGLPLRAVNRPGSQLLGVNGRDDGSIITACTRDGINKISLTGCDTRVFCLGIRLVKRRTVQQILNMIPKESDGERFEEALARVRRCVGGGTPTENADSDSDLEVVADFIPVNLRCPMSGSRMKVAGRFKPCAHMGCFDLEVFVEMTQRSRKWQCPVCLKNYTLENAIIDPYFNAITSKLRNCSEDVTEVEVKPDGSWRAKTEGGDCRSLGNLGLWHEPDGSLSAPKDIESKPKPDEVVRQAKQEGGSDLHAGLKLGMKKNRNGIWEISKQEDTQTYSSGNKFDNGFINHLHNVIPMSSSATGSDKEGEATSVNQGSGNLDLSTNNGTELESLSLNMHHSNRYSEPEPLPDTEVIVLSDSDEETEMLVSSGTIYQNHHQADGIAVPYQEAPNVVPDSYQEDAAFTTDVNSFPAFINGSEEELMQMWSLLPSSSQGAPGFQLFGAEGDGTDSLLDMQQPGSVNCPQMNGYTLDGEGAMGSTALLPDSSVEHPHGDGFVANPLAFDGDDPSLELFLSSRPTDAPVQTELRDEPLVVPNDIPNEDCLELRLGGGGGGGESTVVNGFNSRDKMQSKEGPVNSLADTASFHLGMNDNNKTPTKSSRERSDSPFIFPRQKRSVRPRLYLSMGSDSD